MLIRRFADRLLSGRGGGALPQPHPALVTLSEEDRRYLTSLYDDSVPLPAGAEEVLRSNNVKLAELRTRYARLDLPVLAASRWSAEAVEEFFDLRYFRGETLITWHYRELPRISALKFFLYSRYVRERDAGGFFDLLSEDGAFGCWTFSYPEHPRVSRDLLESINELNFLERQLGISQRTGLRVLDIGAGYGRLAHRMSEALPGLGQYTCVDAIPESTFVSDYYLGYRECENAVSIPLDEIGALSVDSFDLAINIHSFSECTFEAVESWVGLLCDLKIPNLMLIPNEAEGMLTLEQDGSRRDFSSLLNAAGYKLAATEPVIDDPAIKELLDLDDRFYFFTRAT